MWYLIVTVAVVGLIFNPVFSNRADNIIKSIQLFVLGTIFVHRNLLTSNDKTPIWNSSASFLISFYDFRIVSLFNLISYRNRGENAIFNVKEMLKTSVFVLIISVISKVLPFRKKIIDKAQFLTKLRLRLYQFFDFWQFRLHWYKVTGCG